MDVGLKVAHLLLWFGVPWFLGIPVSRVLWVYLLRYVCVGYLMFAVFAPAHAHLPHRQQPDTDYVARQVTPTCNYRVGVVGRFLCAGLQYQIEHHLFPRVCHLHYPALSAHVKQYCLTKGYPYQELDWWAGIRRAIEALYAAPKDGAIV